MRNRTIPAVGALALTLGLSACGLFGSEESSGGASGDESAAEGAQAPTSIDSALLECGDPANDDPTLQLSDVDLTTTTWDMPDGFQESLSYTEDRPVEHIEQFWAADPIKDPLPRNVLVVVVYSGLDWGDAIDQCGRVPISAVDERLAGYNEVNGATALSEVEQITIGELPALQQELSLPEYLYRGYWIFSRNQMVHVYCQWTTDEDKERILAGCQDLIDSVTVPAP